MLLLQKAEGVFLAETEFNLVGDHVRCETRNMKNTFLCFSLPCLISTLRVRPKAVDGIENVLLTLFLRVLLHVLRCLMRLKSASFLSDWKT